MGQRKWAWGCALVVACAVAGVVAAQERADNPFEDPNGARRIIAEPSTNRSASKERSPAEAARRIENVLDQHLRAPLAFVETPLSQVATILAEEYDIPILFDTAALDAVAVSPDVEVSITIDNVSLRMALELMLHNAGTEDLTYLVDREVLLITTQEVEEQRLETRVYRVDDLCRPTDQSKERRGSRFSELVSIITRCVDYESWAVNKTGGAQIGALPPGLLVVTQTRRTHRDVEALLDEIRRVKNAIEGDGRSSQARGGLVPGPIAGDDGE